MKVERFSQVSVPVSVIQIVPYNAKRVGILLKNYAGGTVFVSTDQTDPTNLGFPLTAGDYLGFSDVDGDTPALQIYAIATAAADLRVVESFRDEAAAPAGA